MSRMQKIHDLVYSPEVLDFVKSAKDYVDFLNEDFSGSREEFLHRALILLPGMYSKMLQIPDIQPVFEEGNEKIVTEQEWSEVYQRVYGILGSQNEYVDLPEDEEYDRLESVSRDLSEDLSDIYQDIKDFLEVFRVGTEEVMNDVLWECRMNFENYWGVKLLRASLNLHKSFTRDEELIEKMDSAFMEKHGGKEFNTNEWFISKRQQNAGGEEEFPG